MYLYQLSAYISFVEQYLTVFIPRHTLAVRVYVRPFVRTSFPFDDFSIY